MKRLLIGLVVAMVAVAGLLFDLSLDRPPVALHPTARRVGNEVLAKSFSVGGRAFAPPSAATIAKVSADDALMTAQSDISAIETMPNSAPTVQLASFTSDEYQVYNPDTPEQSNGPLMYQDVPVWLVSWSGACLIEHRTIEKPAPKGCIPATAAVVVDATTGEPIEELVWGT